MEALDVTGMSCMPLFPSPTDCDPCLPIVFQMQFDLEAFYSHNAYSCNDCNTSCCLACRSPPSGRLGSASGSVQDGASESITAPGQQPAQEDSSSASQEQHGPSNEQMVWEMLYNPAFTLSIADAEGAWARATGEDMPQQQVSEYHLQLEEAFTPIQPHCTTHVPIHVHIVS